MLFNWQIQDVCVVFESWHIHNQVDMLISCLVVFCIAAGYEYVRVWSSSLDDKWAQFDKKDHGDEEPAADTSFLRKDMKLVR
jgi:copper transporter 1